MASGPYRSSVAISRTRCICSKVSRHDVVRDMGRGASLTAQHHVRRYLGPWRSTPVFSRCNSAKVAFCAPGPPIRSFGSRQTERSKGAWRHNPARHPARFFWR
jgi:hypothetical protein